MLPRSLIISASSVCFTACPGCYNYFEKTLTSTESIVRLCRDLRDEFKMAKVTVGGGDPLARPDILDLLARLKALGLRIVIDTVGTPLLGEATVRFMGTGTVPHIEAKKLAQVTDLIGIPLDGSTDELQGVFRRFCSVEQQVNILKKLHGVQANICINTVVHKGNLDNLSRVADIITSAGGIEEWQLFQYMPIGPLGFRNRERYEISNEQYEAAVKDIDITALGVKGIKVTAKTAEKRKNRYLLLDASGQLWHPLQTQKVEWDADSVSSERKIIGHIDDPLIIDKIISIPTTGDIVSAGK